MVQLHSMTFNKFCEKNSSLLGTKLWSYLSFLYFADDTAMLWGVKYYNDLLMAAGPNGNVQSEILFRKDPEAFTFSKGWAFPRRVYFNGDNCVMPSPDQYPMLPNSSPRLSQQLVNTIFVACLSLMSMLILQGWFFF